MAIEYATTDQVSGFLQRTAFTTTTSPTLAVVEELIERAQDRIDQETGHAWRTVSISNEYLDRPLYDDTMGGYRLKLRHRNVKTFTSGSGDKLLVWDGESFVDYLTERTAGRGRDYFIDETNGVVFILTGFVFTNKGVKVNYRYGDATVNRQIEEATIKLVSIDILTQFDKAARFADDGPSNRMNHQNRMERWRDDVDRILYSLKELHTV